LVTFAHGLTAGDAVVQFVGPASQGRTGVVVDETPFHPVDHTWPDQPGDVGALAGHPVIDTVMGAMESTGSSGLRVGEEIPVKRGEDGWTWYVVHLVEDTDATGVTRGDRVTLEVDAERRRSLSRAHTACHVAALALNQAVAALWRKPAREDSLGFPDFDQIAMASSRMDERSSIDVYRLGKSLRKKGFDVSALAKGLPAIQSAVQQTIERWTASDAPVAVTDAGDRRITAPRHWTCTLASAVGVIPCGGTHVSSLSEIDGVVVSYDLSADGTQLTVQTTA
jgi:alanyl-tRNA synthetase